jgi:hypothetical protein
MAAGVFTLLLLLASVILSPDVYAESGSAQTMISLIVPATAENSISNATSLSQATAAQYHANTMTLQDMPLSQGHQSVWIAI